MKRLVIILTLITCTSCSIYKKMFSIATNKFPISKENINDEFESWNNKNLYVLKVQLKLDNRVFYKHNNIEKVELSDYPLKDYNFITKPTQEGQKLNVVEELYLYLNNFDSDVNTGKALYMSTIPVKDKMAKLFYNNDYFISTLGINHLMVGDWVRKDNKIILIVNDKKNKLKLVGKIIEIDNVLEAIEFIKVKHPKPLDKNEQRMINIKDVMQVSSSTEDDTTSNVNGIRFFKTKRILVHPDWCKLSKNFDFTNDSNYYKNNYQKRKISNIYIKDDLLYFKVKENEKQYIYRR